jgi:hypothetical protein
MRYLPALGMLLALSGCGLGPGAAGAAGAAGAQSEVQEAAQARKTEEQVRQQLQAAQEEAARQRSDATARGGSHARRPTGKALAPAAALGACLAGAPAGHLLFR